MKKNTLMLLVVPSLFLFSCSRPVIVDAITEEEAINFISTKYAETTVLTPSTETKVVWKINKDDANQTASKHINRYINDADPVEPQPIPEGTAKKVNITDIRAAAFASELAEPLTTDLGEKGHEAVCALNLDIHEALYHGQGVPNTFKLVYKYVGNGASRGLKVTSQYQGTDYVYTRAHTYNKDGHETKFELTFNNGNDLNYTFAINFKY